MTSTRPRLVVGISGSSAPQYGIALLEALRKLGTVETHLVVSAGARRTVELEARRDPDEVCALADVVHDSRDLAAAVSSGSFLTLGMAVVPCSMKTLAAVAHGFSGDLLARAADVTLKERRRLVLVTRETPLGLVHLRNMTAVTEAGAVVLPPVPGFYARPRTIDDLIAHTVGKVLDQFGIEHHLFRRWDGPPDDAPDAPAARTPEEETL
ncbi:MULTISPECIES: UbiX family flavin prenyltransferase [Actinomadura]|uniref:Flavin prenyltransferase UbiX n=1 Tax=Actinomadura yumaensis TaxID=111807 RepID=A0ABW2CUY0_9ACTN|nr:UbiX family flavin prenyltransferase [Actinomadura sp. J1-007]